MSFDLLSALMETQALRVASEAHVKVPSQSCGAISS